MSDIQRKVERITERLYDGELDMWLSNARGAYDTCKLEHLYECIDAAHQLMRAAYNDPDMGIQRK